MKLNNEKGMAMAGTLFFIVILFALEAIFVLQAVHEIKMAKIEREQAKTFYAAHGGANIALEQLDVLINTYLQDTIASANPSGVISYAQSQVSAGDGIAWLLSAVRDNNTAVLTQTGDEATYAASGSAGDQTYNYTITFVEKNDPGTSGPDAWDFPYNFRVEATSDLDNSSGKVFYHGDFTVQVQRDNFAKYALFTNVQQTPGGSNVWFTDKTNFAGPVHTNNRFNFALNPSGTFEQAISQTDQTSRFYNNGFNVLLDANANGATDVPTFNSTFTRGASVLSLSAVTTETDIANQASGGNVYGTNGIYVPTDASGLTGGIYVRGDSTIYMSTDVSNNPEYTITQGGATKIVNVNLGTNQTTVTDLSTASSTTYSGKPDGVDDVGTLIYVDGNVSGLEGTIQGDTAITISSKHDIVITDSVEYANYTAGSGTPGQVGYVPPEAIGHDNLLGLVSWQGDVRIGTSAPDNVNVHGTIMAQTGIFAVDSYNDQGVGDRGTATLLGGVITDNYGAFGLFSGSTGTQLSGYGRNFVYDERMQQGSAPPYFPSLDSFVAFTNDITDKLVWLEGE